MATVIEMPPRIFDADARPTMLYDVGLREHEAQWVVDESRSIVPCDSSTGRRITVRFTGEEMGPDSGTEWGGYYKPELAEIRCSRNGESLGVVVHELPHALGLDHISPQQSQDFLRRNRPFRDAHAQLIDFWEGRLGITRLDDFVGERSPQVSAEVQAAVERFNEMIQ